MKPQRGGCAEQGEWLGTADRAAVRLQGPDGDAAATPAVVVIDRLDEIMTELRGRLASVRPEAMLELSQVLFSVAEALQVLAQLEPRRTGTDRGGLPRDQPAEAAAPRAGEGPRRAAQPQCAARWPGATGASEAVGCFGAAYGIAFRDHTGDCTWAKGWRSSDEILARAGPGPARLLAAMGSEVRLSILRALLKGP